MKKSSFIALIFGIVSDVLFGLGLCMTLLPEWNMFREGIICGSCGLVLGLITLFVWCRIEGKKLPKECGMNTFRIMYTILAVFVFGVGMSMCMVWQNILWGTIIGLVGIFMLIAVIPMLKGLK